MNDAPPAVQDERIRLTTRFGEFEADHRNFLSFPCGLPGFEQCQRFVILASVEAAPLQCLMSVIGPSATFLALEPRLVLPDYRCVLGASDRERIGAAEPETLVWLALLTINDEGHAFANLRAPVVINPARMVGYQVVPQDSLYPLRHPVVLS
jgi:flagellar assembly factor FliW